MIDTPYQGNARNATFPGIQFNSSNRYDFQNNQYEIILVSYYPRRGHHMVEMKFHGHSCLHRYDDMKNIGHALPFGDRFRDEDMMNRNVRRIYLKKID